MRILIVDDEELARRSIRLLLESFTHTTDIQEAQNGREALQILLEGKTDMVFLDIQMPEMSGFDVLQAQERTIAQDPPHGAEILAPITIFVTAFDRYALRAFEASAVDYLLKPFDDERFRQALERGATRLAEREALRVRQQAPSSNIPPSNLQPSSHPLNHSLNEDEQARLMRFLEENPLYAAQNLVQQITPNTPPQFLERLTLQSRNRTIVVAVDDIDWIEAESYYVQIHTSTKSYLMRETMSNLEERLNPRYFRRIHRSAIVNLRAVKSIETQTHGDGIVILRNNTRLKLSRTRRQQFMDAL